MSFPSDIIEKAWKRSKGKCEECGKRLSKSNRGRSGKGSWEPHHIRPRADNGGNSAANCAILCTSGKNCHLEVGHNGNYAKRGRFNRMSNRPTVRALTGAAVGGRIFGLPGAIAGGLIGLVTTPDLTED